MARTAEEGSITRLLGPFRENDPDAAARIWGRYQSLLVDLASRWLGGFPRRVADEEDIAHTAFLTCWQQVTARKYPELADRQDLERILRDLVKKAALDYKKRQKSQKRGGGQVQDESTIGIGQDSAASKGFAAIADPTSLTPDELAEFRSLWVRLFEELTESERQIAIARLADFTVTDKELAVAMKCSVSLIRLRLQAIRRKWKDIGGSSVRK